MKVLTFLCVCVASFLVLVISQSVVESTKINAWARGWNDEINWLSLKGGKKVVKEMKKPGFILIHKT